MAMVGHKTEAIYRRYAIVDDAMLREGAAKLAGFHHTQQPAAMIIPLPTGHRNDGRDHNDTASHTASGR
jgi:hypothetical protein